LEGECYFMPIDRTACPDFLNDYILYLSMSKSLSPRTVEEYYLDIRLFLQYILMMKDKQYLTLDETDMQKISIVDFPVSMLDTIKLQDLYEFLYYVTESRENHDRARGRKVSAIKSLFHYLYVNKQVIHQNPTEYLELPSLKMALPKYLTLEQSKTLLANMNTSYPERDYCIITLFLNCGLRLSELVALNVSNINLKETKMRVFGKGRKERMVYLNHACMEALNDYLEVRKKMKRSAEESALFLSKRCTRISKRRVQQIVEDALQRAGLSGQGYSTHKLRHTAATLMYQYGNVDALTLKEILGHKSTSTTEIYTHLSSSILQDAADHSPLANLTSHTISEENNEKNNIVEEQSKSDEPEVVSIVLPEIIDVDDKNKTQKTEK